MPVQPKAMKECLYLECTNQTQNAKFCSRSCSASHNNKGVIRNHNLKGSCGFCQKVISASRKYCSKDCYDHYRLSKNDGFLIGVTKRCNKCKVVKDIVDFGSNRANPDGLMRQCKSCNNLRVSEFNKTRTTPPIVRPQWKKHGLTEERFKLLGSVCGACGDTESLVIDHDHLCCPSTYSCGKCVRGLLCGHCNRALGLLKDDVDRVAGLMLYLQGTLSQVV